MDTSALEAILFASGKPTSLKILQTVLGLSADELSAALAALRARFNVASSGIHLVEQEDKIQFVTAPGQSAVLSKFLKTEISGELTRPSLETLTIIAYRGPITKPELEQIRGINCSLILRNLLMRALIEEQEDPGRLQPVYSVSTRFLRHLGLHSVAELPDYSAFHDNAKITEMIKELAEKSAAEI